MVHMDCVLADRAFSLHVLRFRILDFSRPAHRHRMCNYDLNLATAPDRAVGSTGVSCAGASSRSDPSILDIKGYSERRIYFDFAARFFGCFYHKQLYWLWLYTL